jgi:hypothetical protein
MKVRSMALVLLVALGVLVACHGASNYVPQNGVNLSDSTLQLDGHWRPAVRAMTSPVCAHIPLVKVPGTYVFMFAFGNLSGKNYTGDGRWFLNDYVPGGTPPSRTPPPGKLKAWLYYGSYTLKTSKQTGCAYLIASESHKPIVATKFGKFRGYSVGTPITHAKHWHVTATSTSGLVTMMVTLSSPTSGSGSAALTTETGTPYDTATITLIGRTAIMIKEISE